MLTGPPAPRFDFEILPVFELSCLASMLSKRCESNGKKWSKSQHLWKKGRVSHQVEFASIFLLLGNFFIPLQQQTTQDAALEWDEWHTSVKNECKPLPLGWVTRYHNSHHTDIPLCNQEIHGRRDLLWSQLAGFKSGRVPWTWHQCFLVALVNCATF